MSSLVFLQYLTTVFDNIDEAIILINVEPKDGFRLLMANESFFTKTGYTKEVIGDDIKDIVSPKGYAHLLRNYRKVVQTKKQVQYTQVYSMPIGQMHYSVKLIPIVSAIGEVVQIAGIVNDITEIEDLRQKMDRTTRTLDSVVGDLHITA